MPNHCMNVLEIQDFESINSLRPEPEDYDKIKVCSTFDQSKLLTSYDEKQYHWRLQNWGCKWEAYEIRKIREGLVFFLTAWAPPAMAYLYYVQHNKDKHIKAAWAEPGMEFFGTFEDGRIVDNPFYPKDFDEMARYLGKEIAEIFWR